MVRLSRESTSQLDEMRRHVITTRPATIQGGFFPLAALAPFAAALGIPMAASAGKWVGKKIFGEGVMITGERMPARIPVPPIQLPATNLVKGAGRSSYRSGDYKMPSMVPIPNHGTGTRTGMQGGMLLNAPGVPDSVKKAIRTIGTIGGKRKKKARKGSLKKKSC